MYFLYCIKLKYKILNSYAGVTEFFFWCLTVMTSLSAFFQAYRKPYLTRLHQAKTQLIVGMGEVSSHQGGTG